MKPSIRPYRTVGIAVVGAAILFATPTIGSLPNIDTISVAHAARAGSGGGGTFGGGTFGGGLGCGGRTFGGGGGHAGGGPRPQQ